MKYLKLSLFALVGVITPLQAANPDLRTFEVKGISVGMSLTDANKHFGDRLICGEPNAGDKVLPGTEFCYVDWKDNPNYAEQTSFAGQSEKLRFFAYEDRIVIVLVGLLRSNDFEVILKGLTDKYGKPVITKETLQNGFGTKFENVTALWVRPSAMISYIKYDGSIEYSDLKFVDIGYMTKLQVESDAANDERTKDM